MPSMISQAAAPAVDTVSGGYQSGYAAGQNLGEYAQLYHQVVTQARQMQFDHQIKLEELDLRRKSAQREGDKWAADAEKARAEAEHTRNMDQWYRDSLLPVATGASKATGLDPKSALDMLHNASGAAQTGASIGNALIGPAGGIVGAALGGLGSLAAQVPDLQTVTTPATGTNPPRDRVVLQGRGFRTILGEDAALKEQRRKELEAEGRRKETKEPLQEDVLRTQADRNRASANELSARTEQIYAQVKQGWTADYAKNPRAYPDAYFANEVAEGRMTPDMADAGRSVRDWSIMAANAKEDRANGAAFLQFQKPVLAEFAGRENQIAGDIQKAQQELLKLTQPRRKTDLKTGKAEDFGPGSDYAVADAEYREKFAKLNAAIATKKHELQMVQEMRGALDNTLKEVGDSLRPNRVPNPAPPPTPGGQTGTSNAKSMSDSELKAALGIK